MRPELLTNEELLPDDPLRETLRELRARGYESLPVGPGDLVIFLGTLDHLSLPNSSPQPRHTFQLHAVDGPDAGVAWSERNWLQYASGAPFPSIG